MTGTGTPTDAPVDATVDVAVIGAGIVGSAVARDLAASHLSVALVEARSDVGAGTSKANTAILHTGFDATPGTLESRLVRRGHALLSAYAAQVGIPVERTGALLVAWTQLELEALPVLRDKAVANGYLHCEIVDAAAVYAAVPALGAGARGGLTVPDEAITCTWTTNLALATQAVERGARLVLDAPVTGVVRAADLLTSPGVTSPGVTSPPATLGAATVLRTPAGDVTARWVVNAAGLGAAAVDALFGHRRFTVTPRRGELVVFDKLARALVDRIVLPVPTTAGKGVLVSPTVYGNVMLGPTADDVDDPTATGTTEHGLQSLLVKGSRLMPRLLEEEVTATYAGLRAGTGAGDYLVEVDPTARYLLVGGIRSTGLTAGMAIAEHVVGLLRDAGLDVTPRDDLPPAPRMPNLGEAFLRPYADADLIARDGAYGAVVCFCERVTLGEIRDAFAATLPPADLDGLRRRTRVTNGRCQGFYCGATVEALVAARGASSGTAG